MNALLANKYNQLCDKYGCNHNIAKLLGSKYKANQVSNVLVKSCVLGGCSHDLENLFLTFNQVIIQNDFGGDEFNQFCELSPLLVRWISIDLELSVSQLRGFIAVNGRIDSKEIINHIVSGYATWSLEHELQ